MLLAIGFPGIDANGGVRIGDVAIAVPYGVHFVESFFVGGAVAPNFLANILNAIAAEIEQARKVIGIADVHGVGISGEGRTRTIFAGEKVLRNNVVGVGSSDKSRDGEAHALGENARGEIAEIAAGNGDDERNRSYG